MTPDEFKALILDTCRAYYVIDTTHKAYVLATAQHESRMGQAMVELSNGDPHEYFKKYDGKLGNDQMGDGYTYRGRGLVQITGRTHYRRFGGILGINLEYNPDLALEPEYACNILINGMADGLFTGVSLTSCGSDRRGFDAIKARRIVNGQDKAALIAAYYEDFLKELRTETDEKLIG